MKWRCWTCGRDFETAAPHRRPLHCEGATYTPYAEVTEPISYSHPDVHGDHEAVVLFFCVAYGGHLGARRNQKGIPCVAVWVPPEHGSVIGALPMEALVPEAAPLNALVSGLLADPYASTAALLMREGRASTWGEARKMAKVRTYLDTYRGVE